MIGGPDLYQSMQRFRQPLIWGLTLLIAGYTWFAVIKQLFLGEPVGSQPTPDLMLFLIWILIGILFPALLWRARLTIRIDRDHLHYRFKPFHMKEHSYRVRQIESAESANIRPVLHFFGWGIRYGFKGKGYIMAGKKALKLNFSSGRPVYFTCDNPDEAVKAIHQQKQN